MDIEQINELTSQWLDFDRNPETRNEIQHLWDEGEWQELHNRLCNRIEFGTAGLRAKMQAGYSSMNDLIIIQAAQGLAAHLSTLPDALKRGVVIGHDHRHNSKRWAGLTTRAFLSKGFKVYAYRGVVHTPLVPFGIKKLNTVGGVMVTASHNPAQDNGWKVYYDNAVQIIPPIDSIISKSILENLEPDDEAWDCDTVREHPLCEDKTNNMRYEYHNHIAALFPPEVAADIPITHTSFHGSADLSIARAFAVTGLPPLMTVRAQRDPDPDFPTLPFPNPEEKGALDLAIKTANSNGSQYILANDPDSDRFLAAERVDDDWHIFTGDEIGTLLASYVIEEYKKSGKPLNKLAIVASTVSSKMIGSMAKMEGFHFEDTLTGFKYIGNKALELENEGYSVDLLYEEAIGYGISPFIRDKDGITAAIAFVRFAAHLKERSMTPYSHLQCLFNKYGHYHTRNDYFKCGDNNIKAKIFKQLREVKTSPNGYPTELGPFKVTNIRDLTEGHAYDSSQPNNQPILQVSAGNMITFYGEKTSGESFVLTIRTSGTEAKIKYYLEISGKDIESVGELLDQTQHALSVDWVKAQENGLL